MRTKPRRGFASHFVRALARVFDYWNGGEAVSLMASCVRSGQAPPERSRLSFLDRAVQDIDGPGTFELP